MSLSEGLFVIRLTSNIKFSMMSTHRHTAGKTSFYLNPLAEVTRDSMWLRFIIWRSPYHHQSANSAPSKFKGNSNHSPINKQIRTIDQAHSRSCDEHRNITNLLKLGPSSLSRLKRTIQPSQRTIFNDGFE